MKKATILFVLLFVGLVIYLLKNQNINNMKGHNEHTSTSKPVDQSHRSYKLDFTQKPQADEIVLNQPATIKYKVLNDKGEILKNFELIHEKLMHFIVVRKDLTQFEHLHPDYNQKTGEFAIDVMFTVDGPYKLFADFMPSDSDNFWKLPVTLTSDLDVGDVANFQPHTVITDKQNRKIVPPDYEVAYSFPSDLKAQTDFTYTLTVTKNGKPVNDLERYLGALGHSVILKEDTLDYIHTHPEEHNDDNSNTSTGPDIDFITNLPQAGKYKVFTQFQHQGKVLTTEYIVETK